MMAGLRLIILALATSLLPTAISAETISYEIYELASNGQRGLITKGQKEYAVKDIVVDRYGLPLWSKTLPLSGGFSVGASIHRESHLEGFGLWMRKDDRGFSWEWFRKETGDIFRKLQGPGRVKVTLVADTDYEELAAVEFLDDVTFRLDSSFPQLFTPYQHRDTHHMIVKKGSVLRVAP